MTENYLTRQIEKSIESMSVKEKINLWNEMARDLLNKRVDEGDKEC